ncbi:adenylate/guanylate cyclase [Salinihabitans flavidus]|uniref:Adenylate/guanylate cyclase n=1 Tax=Salinihabitans flavidus TaxID=569882 RepID=A0A1H8T4C9_9RHOB|nr:adenylate/guanylate cyclase domain-containing protein [Salinihabitans flavidus]SEO85712.1 adenylate/guanylate cyclase [Salinihabitans flavidus]
MPDPARPRRRPLTDRIFGPEGRADNAYTEAALARHKRQGLELAVRARWGVMVVVALMIVVFYRDLGWGLVYYELIIAAVAFNGWVMLRVGRVGQSRAELFLIFIDLFLMTLGMVGPNPFAPSEWPLAMLYRNDNFLYFFLILAAGTLAYSWRTVMAIGIWAAVMWLVALLIAYSFATPMPELSAALRSALADAPRGAALARELDPNNFEIGLRVQEAMVFLMTAAVLMLSVRRFYALLMTHAGLERERANLSRYFSPNMVEELSHKDEPLKQIRTHDVAVLFIDIVGFTAFAAPRSAQEVVNTLRQFHGRMEREVFRYEGTLDKYLGDGLMATFGTPEAGERDATQALRAACAMLRSLEEWNADRKMAGEPEICAGIGLHYGPVVLGDIGTNRLEFTVIGSTVNVASRLEAMTRTLGADLLISDAVRERVLAESGGEALHALECLHGQKIRGVEGEMTLWARFRGHSSQAPVNAGKPVSV